MYGKPDDPFNEPEFWRMTQHEKHEINEALMAELDLHLTLGANGQVLNIKRRVARGQSVTLYKWTGEQPQGESQAALRNRRLIGEPGRT